MRIRWGLPLLAVVVLLTACATPGIAPRERLDGIDVQVKTTPAPLALGPVSVDPDVEIGTQMTLSMPDWPWVHGTLFVYAVGVSAELGQVRAHLVQETRQGMEAAVQTGAYANLEWGAASSFEVPTHPVTARGERLRAHYRKEGRGYETLAYLFYRPPFAIKVRISMPDRAHAGAIDAADAAVRALLPELTMGFGRRCRDNAVDVLLPGDSAALSAAQAEQAAVVALAEAVLQHALEGCTDLEAALAMTTVTCSQFQALCGVPPWQAQPPAAEQTP